MIPLIMILTSAGPAAATPSAPPVSSKPAKEAHSGELLSRPQRVVGRATRAATVEPTEPTFINANAVFAWSDGVVYHAYTTPGRVTDIILQPGEALGSVASGDTARWIIGDTTSGVGTDKRAHVLVKPFAVGLTTNLVITTDRRTYHVLLTSSAGSAMAALSWIYPADEMIALRKVADAAATAAPVATGLEVDRLNFNYDLGGDRPTWRPLRVFDDGRQTFIEFPPSLGVGEAPPLFAIDGTGEATLVNYRVRGRFYIVDRLLDAAELRLGTKKQQVVRITRMEPSARRRGSKR